MMSHRRQRREIPASEFAQAFQYRSRNMTNNKKSLLVFCVLLLLTLVFWWPTLFEGKSLIHGDSIIHGLPLFDFHSRFLHGGETPLWTDKVYGGHPLFAEGQGGFANPLNILLAWLLPPVIGVNIFHLVCMLIAAAGVFVLCRLLGRSAWSAGFAALALVFSTAWLQEQNNLTISGTLAWAPWALAATEAWLRKPLARQAVLLAAAATMMILAGYPQLVHATALYAVFSLFAMPFSEDGRKLWRAQRLQLVTTAALAALLFLGLAAVQLLPLLELASLSHRSAGVGLFFEFSPMAVLRGLLYTPTQLALARDRLDQIPGIGSLLVCMLASLFPLFKSSWREKGILLAVLILIQLGAGKASPLFLMLYDWHLVPGLHFFRTTQSYLEIACIGIAVLAAFVIDSLSSQGRASAAGWRRHKRLWLAAIFYIAAWGILIAISVETATPWQHLAIAALALIAAVILVASGKARHIPLLMFALLLLECCALRLHLFHFGDVSLLRRPATLQALAQRYPIQDTKFINHSLAVAYAMRNSRVPDLDANAERALASNAALSNMRWDTPSEDGALALPLRARALLIPVFENEMEGRTKTGPGQRAIDLLGVRFISADRQLTAPGFQVAVHDQQQNMWIMENTAAQPLFQSFTRYRPVSSDDEALQLLQTPRQPELIIEAAKGQTLPPLSDADNKADAIRFKVLTKQPTFYAVDVDAAEAGWLFLADANYPGWRATIDGQATHVFSGQLLGKAVMVPAGRHKLEFRFSSSTFRYGLWLSLLTLLISAGLLVRSFLLQRRRHRFDAIAR
ncbi:bacterial membrane YfhO family protein [Collimonas pratensis]|uniref:Bacterial membrane YfhO family protein n=2 Tax=Collimonas pratensis TaxID=279113 RepID=A0A127QC03_9BURK|nr:bacterial membrane YfhO family protein [Collimonas pratensis]